MLIQRLLGMLYRDEAGAAGDTGTGGGGGNLTTSPAAIESMSNELSADILGTDTSGDGSAAPSSDDKGAPTGDSALTPEAKEAAEKAAAEEKAKKERDTKLASLDEAGKAKFLADEEAAKAAAAAGDKYKDPPKSLAVDKHQIYSSLTPEAKQLFHEREEQFHRGIDQYRQGNEYGRGIYDLIKPYEPMLLAHGVKSHGQAIQFLMDAHYKLSTGTDEQRSTYMAGLAKQYKINVEAFTKAFGDEAPIVDANVKALQDRVGSMETLLTATQRAEQERLRNKTAAEVTTFASDPANKYFEQVADHIVLLMQDPKISLKDAYDQACWANPAVRATMQAEAGKAAAEASRKAAEEEAAKALKARGTRIKGKETTGTGVETFSGDLDAALRESYQEIKARDS